MSTIIESIEQRQLRQVPRFAAGDRVRVHFQVIEGTRRRTQVFEGIVIARQGSGARETFTVRKQSFGVGVERTFPVHSPKIEQLEVVARGDVRRAKLYYLRGRVGKRARVAERRWGIEDDLVIAEADRAGRGRLRGRRPGGGRAGRRRAEGEEADGGRRGAAEDGRGAGAEAQPTSPPRARPRSRRRAQPDEPRARRPRNPTARPRIPRNPADPEADNRPSGRSSSWS